LFSQQYAQLATKYNITLLPFLLDGIAAQPGMMQADGIHPTTQAQPLMMKAVWNLMKEWVN
jgi:acyl-CoA thioesterase-1